MAAIQRELEGLALLEYRAFKWALLGGVLLWLPILLVLVEGLTGAPILAEVDGVWLGANGAFGMVVLGLGQMLSRKYVEDAALSPLARRVVDALSGRGLRSARAFLSEISGFEAEDAT